MTEENQPVKPQYDAHVRAYREWTAEEAAAKKAKDEENERAKHEMLPEYWDSFTA